MDKDCFTKFPNHLLDAIISGGFHGMQTAVLLYIVRKTYGWGKASDTISVSKMAADTGYNRTAMIKTIQQLEQDKIISVKRNGAGKLSEMSVNDPDSWDKPVACRTHVAYRRQSPTSDRGCRLQTTGDVAHRRQEPVAYRRHTKETKDIINKTTKESSSPTWNDVRAIENENDMSSANVSTESDLILPDEVFEDDSLWT